MNWQRTSWRRSRSQACSACFTKLIAPPKTRSRKSGSKRRAKRRAAQAISRFYKKRLIELSDDACGLVILRAVEGSHGKHGFSRSRFLILFRYFLDPALFNTED